MSSSAIKLVGKRSLDFNRVYQIDLTKRMQIGSIPENILYDIFRDGRAIGLIIEHLVQYEFSGLTRVCGDESSAFDLIKTDFRIPVRIQCKTFKDDSCKLCPSKMLGKGRKFDLDGFNEYLEKIDSYLLVKNSDFPRLKILLLNKSSIVSYASINESGAAIKKTVLNELFER